MSKLSTIRRILLTGTAILGATGTAVLALETSSSAVNPVPVVRTCTATGTIYFGGTATTTTWTLNASGSCNVATFPVQPTETVTLTGTGTSGGLGTCTGTLPVATNLDLTTDVNYTNTVTGKVIHDPSTLSLPITTFPITSPFIKAGTIGSGAGTVFIHIFAGCGNNGGKPSAQFVWTEDDDQ
ncbi:MAG TPA: hypothetical protein VMV14_07935 [Acidimicrobiales bacterium]|nr:hypothetical protein [Acidimicrobiales bacterium]